MLTDIAKKEFEGPRRCQACVEFRYFEIKEKTFH